MDGATAGCNDAKGGHAVGKHEGGSKKDKPFEPKPPGREQGDSQTQGGGSREK
jgi:hypothetical protein